MTEDGFKALIRPLIEHKTAFIAYWHPRGWGLLKTGWQSTYRGEYIVHRPGKPDKRYRDYSKAHNREINFSGAWIETVRVEGKPRKVSDTTVKRWRAGLDRLRRSGFGTVYTVEFDGNHIMTEGGIEL